MVKGISRRIIVVRSPDPRFFEQAIFLLKEDALHPDGISAEQVVNEARQAAAGYVRRASERSGKPQRKLLLFPPLVWFILGACSTGLVWWMVQALCFA